MVNQVGSPMYMRVTLVMLYYIYTHLLLLNLLQSLRFFSKLEMQNWTSIKRIKAFQWNIGNNHSITLSSHTQIQNKEILLLYSWSIHFVQGLGNEISAVLTIMSTKTIYESSFLVFWSYNIHEDSQILKNTTKHLLSYSAIPSTPTFFSRPRFLLCEAPRALSLWDHPKWPSNLLLRAYKALSFVHSCPICLCIT